MTIDIKLKTYEQLQFEITTLNTNLFLKDKEIERLNNIINELEAWIKSADEHYPEAIPFRETLRKLKELKEGE